MNCPILKLNMKIQFAFITSVLAAISSLGIGAALVTPSAQAEDTACGYGSLERSFETWNYWVYICRNSDELFYVGVDKSNPNNSIRLPAYRTRENSYRANNRDTDYSVSSNRLEVSQNGRLILSEPVINVYTQTPDNQGGSVTSELISRFREQRSYCDAKMLSAFWRINTDRAKAKAVRIMERGRPGTLERMLTNAQNSSEGQQVICNFTEEGYSFEDAEALANFWNVRIGDAKTRVEQKLRTGNYEAVKTALELARNQEERPIPYRNRTY